MSANHPPAIPPRIAVVIPCYRSSRSLVEIVARLSTVFAHSRLPYELIFIDDASPDPDTWRTLKQLHAAQPDTIRCFRLARNSGQHNAIHCGLSQLSENVEVVVTMDDDLQHRPEDVPAFLDAIENGADIAIGAYGKKHHARWRNAGGDLIDASLRRLFQLPKDFQLTSFRALRRFVADDVLENNSRYSYLTAAMLAVTRFRTNVPITHEPRNHGQSGYSIASSIELAANLFLSYSRWPLYLVVSMFLLSLFATVSVTAWAFWRWMVADHPPEGWASTIMMLGICNTFNLAALAVIAILSTRSHRQLVGSTNRWRIADHA